MVLSASSALFLIPKFLELYALLHFLEHSVLETSEHVCSCFLLSVNLFFSFPCLLLADSYHVPQSSGVPSRKALLQDCQFFRFLWKTVMSHRAPFSVCILHRAGFSASPLTANITTQTVVVQDLWMWGEKDDCLLRAEGLIKEISVLYGFVYQSHVYRTWVLVIHLFICPTIKC